MDNLMKSAKAQLLISEKISNLEGIIQKGEILKKALPDRFFAK